MVIARPFQADRRVIALQWISGAVPRLVGLGMTLALHSGNGQGLQRADRAAHLQNYPKPVQQSPGRSPRQLSSGLLEESVPKRGKGVACGHAP